MTRIALKGLLGRKVRAALTAFAIVLGVAMVSGSFVLTDTISKAFDTVFSSAYERTDAVVSGRQLVDYSASGGATVTPALLRRIRALPDVAAAAGAVLDLEGNSTQAKLIDRTGKVIQTSGNPTFGFGVDPAQPRFNPLGFDLPEASSVYAWRTVIVSLLVGTLVTLLAGIAPALRATRVAPIAAVKEGTAAQPRRRRGLIAGATLLVLAVLLLGYAISGDRLGSPASLLALLVGAFALLSGTAAVASRLVTALATVLGLPARRFGAQRKRSPHRTPSGTPRARQRPRRR